MFKETHMDNSLVKLFILSQKQTKQIQRMK